MKFFSLISEKQVRLAPGVKKIPASEIATLQEASQILEAVQKDALEFKKKAAIELETIKEAAFAEGFQAGLEKFNSHLFSLDEELKQLRDEIQKRILPLSLSAARKIIGEELKHHPERIVDIVLNSLKPVTQHKKIKIYVNKTDLAMLEQRKPEIKNIFEHLQSLQIEERDDVEPGGCIIETEAGIINAQLESQWRALEAAFASYKGNY